MGLTKLLSDIAYGKAKDYIDDFSGATKYRDGSLLDETEEKSAEAKLFRSTMEHDKSGMKESVNEIKEEFD